MVLGAVSVPGASVILPPVIVREPPRIVIVFDPKLDMRAILIGAAGKVIEVTVPVDSANSLVMVLLTVIACMAGSHLVALSSMAASRVRSVGVMTTRVASSATFDAT